MIVNLKDDNRRPSKNVTLIINVAATVTNEHDNTTILTTHFFEVNLYEGDGPGKLVVSDMEVDDAYKNAVKFSLLNYHDSFTIKEESGEIKTKITLISNVSLQYIISLRASDGIRSDYAKVVVNILKINNL